MPSKVILEPAFDFREELHPLLYEWYFTRPSTEFVAQIAASAADNWLCLGTPSVASELTKHRGRLQLVDADPAVVGRFKELRGIPGLSISEVGGDRSLSVADVTIIDPPWYLGDVYRWLRIARSNTRDGGTIVAPIFPELTRPAAWRERGEILALAETVGTVELHPTAVSYSTPRFELETLRALGLPDPGDWRVADLLVIRNVQGKPAWPRENAIHLADTGWSTFLVNEQVIKLRIRVTGGASRALWPIEGCPGNVLTSVSERDPRRASVDLWTSRNRVAQVGNRELIAVWLRLLEDPESRDRLLANPPTATSFQTLLELIDF